MKKTYLAIFLLILSILVQSQIVNIPDANFKYVLLNVNVVDIDLDGLGDVLADSNHDGEIQVEEAEAVEGLIVAFDYISSLEGIQSFTNLIRLDIWQNELVNVDLSQNTNLQILNCYDNFLTSLDISQCPNLTILNCKSNALTDLDVSQNSNLIELWCNRNQLKSLDVSQNLLLEKLSLWDNLITNIDVTLLSNLKLFSSADNPLSNIDVTNNPNLDFLLCYWNNLSSLDVSQNNNLATLECTGNNLTDLDLSQNSNLMELFCQNNQLTSLNINNGNNVVLNSFYAGDNPNLNCIQVDDVEYANNQTDWHKDEIAVYSEECVLGIEDDVLASKINLYPNPVKNALLLSSNIVINKIKVYDILGKVIFNEENNFNILNLADLQSGVLFVKIEVETGVITKKLLKIDSD